jgi:hypothetical protein
MTIISQFGEIEEEATPEQLSSVSDDELVAYARAAAGTGGYQDDQHDAFKELWKRYENKKKECEELERARDNNWNLYLHACQYF